MEKQPGEMSPAELKHEMILWEARWLQSHGWEAVDIVVGAGEGYIWKAPGISNLACPFNQASAVAAQKELDNKERGTSVPPH